MTEEEMEQVIIQEAKHIMRLRALGFTDDDIRNLISKIK